MKGKFKGENLSEFEKWVIFKKGTEPPFQNEYWNHFEEGIYRCKLCSQPLFRSQDKFFCSCGWPSFDRAIEGAVREIPEEPPDDRIEVVCSRCGAHLGHVFYGEVLTKRNTRYCINSASIKFSPKEERSGSD